MAIATADNGLRRIARVAVPAAFLVLGLAALVAFGFLGIGRGSSDYAFDMRYLYVAGEMWEDLLSPYDFEAFKANMKAIAGIDSGSFSYPPNAAPLTLLLSLGSPGFSEVAIGALNVASLCALVLFMARGAADAGDFPRHAPIFVIAAAVVIGNPFAAHVLWMGQTTLVSAAFLFGCWLFADRRSDVVAGILLGISAFKPQLAFLVGFWFLLDRRWTLIAAAAVTTLILSILPIAAAGLGGSWLGWLGAIREYSGAESNIVTFRHVFGLRSLFAASGIAMPSLMPVAMICVALLYFVRRNYENIWLVTAILAISVLMLYAHDYDVAPATIMAYPLLRAARGRASVLIPIMLLAAVIFFPQRIWEGLDLSAIARSREIAVLAMLAIYLVICRIPAAAPARTAGPVLH